MLLKSWEYFCPADLLEAQPGCRQPSVCIGQSREVVEPWQPLCKQKLQTPGERTDAFEDYFSSDSAPLKCRLNSLLYDMTAWEVLSLLQKGQDCGGQGVIQVNVTKRSVWGGGPHCFTCWAGWQSSAVHHLVLLSLKQMLEVKDLVPVSTSVSNQSNRPLMEIFFLSFFLFWDFVARLTLYLWSSCLSLPSAGITCCATMCGQKIFFV
jgi:hypothetical protein